MTNSAEMLRTMALRGHGILLAPSFLAADEIATGQLVRLLPGYQPVEFAISAIYPHRHNVSTKVRCFIDLVAERFADHRRWLAKEIDPHGDATER